MWLYISMLKIYSTLHKVLFSFCQFKCSVPNFPFSILVPKIHSEINIIIYNNFVWNCSVTTLCLTHWDPISCSMPEQNPYQKLLFSWFLSKVGQIVLYLSKLGSPQTPHQNWLLGFLGGSDGKETGWNGRTPSFNHWVKIPGRRKWWPTNILAPGTPIDRGAWWATVHGIPKSQTWLFYIAIYILYTYMIILSCWSLFQMHCTFLLSVTVFGMFYIVILCIP